MDRHIVKSIALLMSILEASHEEVLVNRVTPEFVLFYLDGQKFLLTRDNLCMRDDSLNTMEDVVHRLELL